MPIEVRQLLIKSTVDAPAQDQSPQEASPETLERLKDEIIAECKAWFEEKLQQMRER